MTASALMTADELERLPDSGKRMELVRGHLVVSDPPGFRHGDIVVKLSVVLSQFVRAAQLGRVLAESGYVLATNPDTVRGPDISFVRQEHIPDPIPIGFAHFAPDLAIEVLSPSNRPGKVLEKVADYLNAGTQLVWVIDPERREAHVYRANGTLSVIAETSALDGEDVLPGFVCPLSQIL